MTRSLGLSLSLGLLATLAACHDSDPGNNQARGYLSSDPCASSTDATSCAAAERGCRWVSVDPDVPVAQPGTATPTAGTAQGEVKGTPPSNRGACVTNSVCFTLDQAGCQANGACAWAGITSICPAGATCMSTGFCHPKDDAGTDCACVSPAACPPNADCKPVECDCSGGGAGGSGGSCACACPACAPGQDCPPCVCNCDDGGPGCTSSGGGAASPNGPAGDAPPPLPTGTGTGSGTSMSGACECACAPCQDGTSCPPCVCNCPATPVDSCSSITDASKCTAEVGCGILQSPAGSGIVCVPVKSGGGSTGCVPPTAPVLPVGPSGPICKDIGCANTCVGGYAKDASGCPTCECLPTR